MEKPLNGGIMTRRILLMKNSKPFVQLQKTNFLILLDSVRQILFRQCLPVPEDETKSRHISKKDLLTFLCKIKQGFSDDFLRAIFNYKSRQSVSLAVADVRKSLVATFVPNNLGFGAISRETFINEHVTEFANSLYNPNSAEPKVISYIDGTYSYIQKSSNFQVPL